MATESGQAKELARRLRRFGPKAVEEFWSELSKSRPSFLEDLSDVVISLVRRREPRRRYSEFVLELRSRRDS